MYQDIHENINDEIGTYAFVPQAWNEQDIQDGRNVSHSSSQGTHTKPHRPVWLPVCARSFFNHRNNDRLII